MRIALSLLLALVALGCQRPEPTIGGECSFNSDCGNPLVCSLGHCRRQCIDSRDCGAGLLCLLVGDQGGVCQLPEERECSLTSDCNEALLVCRFGTCTTECAEDRDCPPGAVCSLDPDEGLLACNEPSADVCVYNSDCPEGLVCNDDQRCVIECIPDAGASRDCAEPQVCIDFRCQIPDGG